MDRNQAFRGGRAGGFVGVGGGVVREKENHLACCPISPPQSITQKSVRADLLTARERKRWFLQHFQLCGLRFSAFGFGKRCLLEKGSFQESLFLQRFYREFRDSRGSPDCGKQRRIRPFSRDSREFTLQFTMITGRKNDYRMIFGAGARRGQGSVRAWEFRMGGGWSLGRGGVCGRGDGGWSLEGWVLGRPGGGGGLGEEGGPGEPSTQGLLVTEIERDRDRQGRETERAH